MSVVLLQLYTPNHDAERLGVVAEGTPAPAGIRRLQLILIKPSKYDDDGYVMRYVRGVLPSNTLATLAGLTREVASKRELGDVHVELLMLDEHVQKIDVRRLARRYRRPGCRPVVALCGVQTNQFPRAADLAREFRNAGLPVMVGGFHVSGAIAMSTNGIPPECRELMESGVTLVKGEVEACWADLLRDALHDRLRPYYDVVDPPDLARASVPVVDPRLMKRYAYPYMGTIDAGRGCPFKCSFCTIINVQGRTMRNRAAAQIQDRIRRNAALKIDFYFFTDDNFSRNPNWREIFEAIIELRRRENIRIEFMMQIDTLAHRLPDFMDLAAEAGCSQVFIGMESVNPANLIAAGKRQNHVGDYRAMIDGWHAREIACHVGYIIGFPGDTTESVADDVRRLKEEIGVDQASFFMLTPLPGSADHKGMVERGEWMDPDYNRFDSFHATTNHPNMSADTWYATYRDAWSLFYTLDHMKTVLRRASDRMYWGMFKNFVWYKHSVMIDDTHPMICGFFRLKDRRQRRPGHAVEPLWAHALMRGREIGRWCRGTFKLYFEMQEVWLATRGRPQLQENLEDLRLRYANVRDRLGDAATRTGQALGRQVASVRSGAGEAWHHVEDASRHAADEVADQIGRLRRRRESRPRRRSLTARFNPFAIRTHTRAHLNAYWRSTGRKLFRGRIFQINPFGVAVHFLRDLKICTRFNLALIMSYGK